MARYFRKRVRKCKGGHGEACHESTIQCVSMAKPSGMHTLTFVSSTFSPSTMDDKEKDEILHHKINIFRWIREEHLDIPMTDDNGSFLAFAESELLKMNNYKAPRDKLICILNCCKVIFGLMKHMEGDEGADVFLPLLIYVVIRANPPKLISNVQ